MEVSIRRVHAVHEVGKSAGQLDMGEVSPKIADATVATSIDELVDVIVVAANQFQLVVGNVEVPPENLTWLNLIVATLAGPSRLRRSGATGIGSEADQ